MESAFDGVRVLDLTSGIAGPVASMFLADLGADVLRVEGPEGDHSVDLPAYLCVNRNKTVAVADLTTVDGRREVRRTVAAADVVFVDRSREDLEALRLDGAAVLAANPHVVHVWLPAFGEVGRWSSMPADPVLLAAASGVADMQSVTGEAPVVPIVPMLHYEQGLLAAVAATAGLIGRTRTGRGRRATVSGLHAVAAMLGTVLTKPPGAAPMRKSSQSHLPQFRQYRCADGEWLFLGALTEPFFMGALGVLDRVELILTPGVDGEFGNLLLGDNAVPVVEAVAARFAERPRDEWLADLVEAGVPCAPVNSRDDWLVSETVAANQLTVALEHELLGQVTLPAPAFTLDATPWRIKHLPAAEADRVPLEECWIDLPPATALVASAPAEGAGADAAPLAGMRVVDLCTFVAGPLVSSILASYGAEVVKVESLEGDPYRMFGLPFDAFSQLKLDLAMDLKNPEGYAVLQRLVERADVCVDNLRSGPKARIGIDSATLRTINPNLICCTATGFGEVGELAATPAFDPLVQARSGLLAAQGGADGPVFSISAVHDIFTGTLGALGTLAALFHRQRTGRSQDVQVSLARASMLAQLTEFVRYEGRPPAPVGSRDWPGPQWYQRLYACADGWIGVAAVDPSSRRALERLSGGNTDEQVAGLLAPMPVGDALDLLDCHGVPAVSVLSRDRLFTDPWLTENDVFRDVDDHLFGRCTVVHRFTSWPEDPVIGVGARPAARLGEHTREVLAGVGLDDEQIEMLIAARVVRTV